MEKSKMSSILIVEDDIALRQKIRDILWSAFPTISDLVCGAKRVASVTRDKDSPENDPFTSVDNE